jgi:hypothetical protein
MLGFHEESGAGAVSMSQKPRILKIFMALFMLWLLTVPGLAHAAVTDQCADGSVDKAYQSALGQAAQQQIKIANQTLGLFGAIDIQSQYCWQRIENVLNIAVGISDPLNLIWQAISSAVLQAMNQLCSSVVSSLGSLVSLAMSQLNRLCLPMPTFSIGGFAGLGLGLNAPTCTGIPLAGPVPSPAMSGWPTFDPRLMIPAGP